MIIASLGYWSAIFLNSVNKSSAFWGALKHLWKIVNLQFNLPSAIIIKEIMFTLMSNGWIRLHLAATRATETTAKSIFGIKPVKRNFKKSSSIFYKLISDCDSLLSVEPIICLTINKSIKYTLELPALWEPTIVI